MSLTYDFEDITFDLNGKIDHFLSEKGEELCQIAQEMCVELLETEMIMFPTGQFPAFIVPYKKATICLIDRRRGSKRKVYYYVYKDIYDNLEQYSKNFENPKEAIIHLKRLNGDLKNSTWKRISMGLFNFFRNQP